MFVSHRMTPPEMNTSQLLLVSSIGLAVNLFGMFAMGGHHHHVRCHLNILSSYISLMNKGGHSHSHGHGSSVAHTHSHSHTHTIGAVKQITESMSEPQIGSQGDEAIVIRYCTVLFSGILLISCYRESASYPISTKPQNLVDHLRTSVWFHIILRSACLICLAGPTSWFTCYSIIYIWSWWASRASSWSFTGPPGYSHTWRA